MSELKRHHINQVMDMHNLTRGEMGFSFVYYADEADKVIADLEESHKKEVEQLLMEIVKLKADYKEACGRLQTANLIKDEQLAATHHHKYKRCKAKAEACMHKRWRTDEGFDYARSTRHMNKWLELAEKFKEAK